jgi:hypothetical protein
VLDQPGAILEDLANGVLAWQDAGAGAGVFDANFIDVETREKYWLSGPHRDRGDTRYSNVRPHIDENAGEAYEPGDHRICARHRA